MKAKPSDLVSFPYMSVTGDGSAEHMACIIRDALINRNDKFGKISLDYVQSYWKRQNPKAHITNFPRWYFYQVDKYLWSAEKAASFSERWKQNLADVEL